MIFERFFKRKIPAPDHLRLLVVAGMMNGRAVWDHGFKEFLDQVAGGNANNIPPDSLKNTAEYAVLGSYESYTIQTESGLSPAQAIAFLCQSHNMFFTAAGQLPLEPVPPFTLESYLEQFFPRFLALAGIAYIPPGFIPLALGAVKLFYRRSRS